jgi:hypothetical protein
MASGRICNGTFSEATKQILRDDPHGIASLQQRCEGCGTMVVAKNKAGEWMPDIHRVPLTRRPGKSNGSKR